MLEEVAAEYYYKGKIDYEKVNSIQKSWCVVSERNKKTYYYNRIGKALHSSGTNRILGIKYLILSLFYNPLNYSSYKSIFAALLPRKLYLKLKDKKGI